MLRWFLLVAGFVLASGAEAAQCTDAQLPTRYRITFSAAQGGGRSAYGATPIAACNVAAPIHAAYIGATVLGPPTYPAPTINASGRCAYRLSSAPGTTFSQAVVEQCTVPDPPEVDVMVTTCSAACTITVLLTPNTASGGIPADRLADYTALFALFLAAGVFVLLAKWLYSYFRVDRNES